MIRIRIVRTQILNADFAKEPTSTKETLEDANWKQCCGSKYGTLCLDPDTKICPDLDPDLSPFTQLQIHYKIRNYDCEMLSVCRVLFPFLNGVDPDPYSEYEYGSTKI